ncbi:MAG: hypothetical protein COA86_18100 [Kangiella sp.]|nr:MAG: hypothetical protein COA86_18100 [Kangiella sp.]
MLSIQIQLVINRSLAGWLFVRLNQIFKLTNIVKISLLISFLPLSANAGNSKLGQSMNNFESTLSQTLLTQIKIVVQKQHKSPINQFDIVKVESRDWPNSALGCPKADMQYMQMITPGYLFHVKAEGILHTVHTSKSHAVVCGQSKPDSLNYASRKKLKLEESTINRVKAIQLSRAMLIKTKEIETKNVRLKSVSDASISEFSAQCKQNYFGKEKGYKVILSHEKLIVTFFSDGKEVVKCKSSTVI